MEITDVLRMAPLFADLPDERLHWLAEHGRQIKLQPGDRIASEGDPADGLYVVLKGETEWTKWVGGQEVHVVTLGPGTIFAELILLLDAPYPTNGRALTEVCLLKLEPDAFWELLSASRSVLRGIVAIAAERSELHASVSQQQARLISLGTMAAGLAHELNNPAAAVQRGTGTMLQVWEDLSSRAFKLDSGSLTEEQQQFLLRLPREVTELGRAAAELDPLARSDREDEVAAWLDEHGVVDAWELASTLVDTGLDTSWLEYLAQNVPDEALADVLAWLAAKVRGDGLLHSIQAGADRLSSLVGAIKEYTYMDQAPRQEVDIHAGLENTLVILGHKLMPGIKLTRDYDPNLPRLTAYGGELNQVWTNLIDNAIDAVGQSGQVTIRTAREPDRVLVEIADDGPGIPPDLQERIWEPFYTTKGVGEGVGLGLDIARRIVVDHHKGAIRVESRPGATRFQVRLPVT